MKLEEKLTSFNLVNNRKYVHSSTIIDFIWKNIKQYVPSGFKQPIFMDIKFHQELKKNANFILFDQYQDISKIKNLSVESRIYSENLNLYIYLVEDQNSDILNNIELDYSVTEMVVSGDYSGSCIISAENSLTMIGNIIEANKRIHELTYLQKEKLKVINLYMKKFPINILNSKFTKLKTLISNIGISNFKGNNTTLNRIELVDYNKFSFEIAFLIKKLGNAK